MFRRVEESEMLTEMHTFEWLDEGPVGVGSRYYVDKESRGQVRRYDLEITWLQENRIFGFVSEAPGFSRVGGVWEPIPRFDIASTCTYD